MSKRLRPSVAASLAGLCILSGCSDRTEHDHPVAVLQASASVGNAVVQRENTTSTRRVPHPLSGVAAIVEATVARTWYEFDPMHGPRTFVELSDVIVHAGREPPKPVFSQLGGPLPDGTFIHVEELSEFIAGSRYVLFFGRETSVYTPVWSGLAFRLETVDGKLLVVGSSGHAVTRFESDGVSLGRSHFPSPKGPLTMGPAPARMAVPPAGAGADDERGVDTEDALSLPAFVAAAVEATLKTPDNVLGESFTMEPGTSDRWNVRPTTTLP